VGYRIIKIANTNLKGLENSLNETMKANSNYEIIGTTLLGHYELTIICKVKEED
jgi:hypothetical protein